MPATDDTVNLKPRPLFAVRSFGLSDQGQKRETNEDCFAIAELARMLWVHQTNLPQSKTNLSFQRGYVFLVADGVGGSQAGEIASGLSVTTIEDFLLNTLKRFSNLRASEEQGALRELQDALCQADSRIFEETAKTSRMGRNGNDSHHGGRRQLAFYSWLMQGTAVAIFFRVGNCNS